VNSKLNHIQNWPELALQANWSAAKLAKLCGISARTLHRHFLKHLAKSPKVWLAEQRQLHAFTLLRAGSSIKEIAASLNYKQQTNFTRHFKNQHGVCPSLSPPPLPPTNPPMSAND
jgi:hypothetical protein